MRAFLTGSRAFGTPTPESDVDVVVLMDKPEMAKLVSQAEESERSGDYGNGQSLRFGRLNLIVVNTEEQFGLWRDSTDECLAMKPVSKEAAAQLFRSRESANAGGR